MRSPKKPKNTTIITFFKPYKLALLLSTLVIHASTQNNIPKSLTNQIQKTKQTCAKKCSENQICLYGTCKCTTGYEMNKKTNKCSTVLKDAFIIARSTLAPLPGQGIEVRLFDGSHLPRGVHHSLDSLVTDILRMDAATGWAYGVTQEQTLVGLVHDPTANTQNNGDSISSSVSTRLPYTQIYRFKITERPWKKEIIFTDSDPNLRISALTVSSLHNLIFYSSDEQKSKIYAISLSQPMLKPKVVIAFRGLNNIKSMACSENYVFFVNNGERIERMSLSGKSRVILIDTRIVSLRSIKVIRDRLYFADSKKIESVDFNGGDRRVHVSRINPTDFIVTSENKIYWLDARKQAILTVNGDNGGIEMFIRRSMTSISDSALVLYSADGINKNLPLKTEPEFCKTCGENALCFSSSKTCKCSPGYTFNKKTTECINQIQKSLFLTKKRVFNTYGKDVVNTMLGANFSIYRVPTELDYDIEIPVVSELQGLGEAIAVSNNKEIYIAQYLSSYEGTITKIQNWEDRRKVGNDGSEILSDDLILNDLGKVNSLALDEMNQLLYRRKLENVFNIFLLLLDVVSC